MLTRRTVINGIVFLLVSTGLIAFGATRFLFAPASGRTLTIATTDAGGVLPRSDVTVRGVPSGAVRSVRLNPDGTADVFVALDPGVTVTQGTRAEITRRSPIGDITINLIPGDGAPLPDGGHIPIGDTIPLPGGERTVEVLAQLLEAVPPDRLDTLVHELHLALDGRGEDLGTLATSGADLAERIARVRKQLRSLIVHGSETLDVLADNAPVLGDDIAETAVLADILRDRRFDLVDLSREGADFAEVLGELLSLQKANLACLINDFGKVNQTLIEPEHLKDLKDTLRYNHFFFDGVNQAVRGGKDGFDWFRVHFLNLTGNATDHMPNRPAPDVFGGHACRSRFGPGVGPGTQAYDPPLWPGSELHRGR
jgi:phospholipid/cholesterol/gamma-HCH transport system substrate-binding protein